VELSKLLKQKRHLRGTPSHVQLQQQVELRSRLRRPCCAQTLSRCKSIRDRSNSCGPSEHKPSWRPAVRTCLKMLSSTRPSSLTCGSPPLATARESCRNSLLQQTSALIQSNGHSMETTAASLQQAHSTRRLPLLWVTESARGRAGERAGEVWCGGVNSSSNQVLKSHSHRHRPSRLSNRNTAPVSLLNIGSESHLVGSLFTHAGALC